MDLYDVEGERVVADHLKKMSTVLRQRSLAMA